MVDRKQIAVEIAYASKDGAQVLRAIKVDLGTTISAAIIASGILEEQPEINLALMAVGVFGQERQLDDVVKAGDRIEIYRPLLIDPKAARRAKAKKLSR